MFDKWITNKTAAPFYARKNFVVTKEIKKAEAKVCGLGQFNFYMNGQRASDHELDPAWTDYNKLVQYVVFDVTDLIASGENVIGAEVGNGWYIKMDEHYTFAFPPFMPKNPNPYKPFGKNLVLAMELVIIYTDGSDEVLIADETFKVKEHPVIMTNVYGSETIDGQKVQKGWNTAGFDDGSWESASLVASEDIPKGKLAMQFQPPVKVLCTYNGTFLGNVGGKDIYDFGQNMSGILEFEAKGKVGDEIRIYPAEKLAKDGSVDQMAKGWVKVDSCITYIIGEDDIWEKCRMTFTYFAGRYVAVEYVMGSLNNGTKIITRNIVAHSISSAYKTDGSFSCNDKRYEKIYNMIERTVEANMLGVHTDCPTIERFAWQEPNHLMAPSIFYMKDGKKLWEKFLLDIRMGQHTGDDWFYNMDGGKVYPGEGLVPSQCPCYIPNVLPVPGLGDFYDIIPWGSTSILGTYWHYMFYGDVTIIKDNYEMGIRYLNHLKTRVNDKGFINYGLGDWGNPQNHLARENIETAFLYADAKTLAEFASILGKVEDKKNLMAYAEKVKDNYNQRLLIKHPDRGFWCYKVYDHPDEIFLTQASQALPLFWGMVPKDKKADIINALRFTLESEGAFICGEVGLPYVIQTARQYGMNKLISSFILKEEHPSYYAFILDGETTLGEYWESNPRSHCHDMMGHIIEWYYNGIAGIIPEEPGFKKVTIRPYLPETIHNLDCSYASASGIIKVNIKEMENEILLKTEVPENVKCETNISNLLERGKKIRIVI